MEDFHGSRLNLVPRFWGQEVREETGAGIMDLEICVDSVESAIAAAEGGAKRIELCSALSEGGITPSAGLIDAVRAAVEIEVFIIVRPRGGDFVYSEQEFDVMCRDIAEAKARNVDGVVIGVLEVDNTVDVVRTRRLVALARPLRVTFHRAFDVCADPNRALEDVIAAGVDRILTSGGMANAMEGVATIAELQEKAGDRVRIMAGGGVRASNVQALVKQTGVGEVHTSLSKGVNEAAELGSGLYGYGRYPVSASDVLEFKAAMEDVKMDALNGAS